AREDIAANNFTSFAKGRFLLELADVEQLILEILNARMNGTTPEVPSALPLHLTGLDLTLIDSKLFGSPLGQPLGELAKFERLPGKDPLSSYLYNSGGLFGLKDWNVATTWTQLATRSEAALVPSKLDEIKSRLNDTQILLNSIREVLWTKEF